HDPQGRSLHVDGDLSHADRIQQAGIVLGQQMALIKQELTGGRICHGIDQLVAGDALPQGQLLVELVPAHGGQVVAPGVEEQVVDQGLAGLHRGGLAG
ncbi:YabP/YqfC family sporulation protein, partial [Dysosmobacter welbionis]